MYLLWEQRINMSVEVKYNNESPWGSETPFVIKTTEPIYYGGKWGQVSNFTLNGTITSGLASGQSQFVEDHIIDTFSKNLKEFSYSDTSGPLFNGIAIVESVDFDRQRWGGLATYAVRLKVFESDYFSGQGVLEPVDEYSYTEETNGTISITHSISAKGFVTTSDALDNAKTWVHSRSGYNYTPISASGCSHPSLIKVTENINRLDASYGIQENYICDTGAIEGIYSRFNTEIISGINNEFVEVNVRSETRGHKTGNMSDLRDFVPSLATMYSEATTQFEQAGFGGTLNNAALTDNVDEEQSQKLIRRNASFNNNIFHGMVYGDIDGTWSGALSSYNNVYFDYKVSVKTDQVTNVSTISIDGDFKTKGGDFYQKSGYIDAYINAIKNAAIEPMGLTGFLYHLASGNYYRIGGTYEINPLPKNWVLTKNELQGTASLSAEFSDADFKPGYTEASYDINVSSPIPYRQAHGSFSRSDNRLQNADKTNGYWNVQDLGINTREKVDINVTLASRHYGLSLDASSPYSSPDQWDINEPVIRADSESVLEDVKNMITRQGDPVFSQYVAKVGDVGGDRFDDASGIQITSGIGYNSNISYSMSHQGEVLDPIKSLELKSQDL